MKNTFVLLVAAVLCGALQCTLRGQVFTNSSQLAASPAFQPTQLEITPYVWGLQINSDDHLGNQALNAELSLRRILHNLTGLAEVEVVPRYKHAFVFGDGIYASLDPKPKQVISGVDHIDLQAGLRRWQQAMPSVQSRCVETDTSPSMRRLCALPERSTPT